jgi:threonine aldolase
MLCGDATFIDQIPHQIKILGGTMLRNWSNTAMALHYLNGIDERWQEIVRTSDYFISELNKLEGVTISALSEGSNVYNLKLAQDINHQELTDHLYSTHNISLVRVNEEGIVKFKVNETLLSRDPEEIVHAWLTGIESIRG